MDDNRSAILAWRERDPEVTASEMAEGLGISRARVSELLKALGLRTRTRRSDALKGPKGRQGIVVPAQSRIVTGGVAVAISHTVAGTIAELLVAADLSARGYTVYAPISRHHGHADLIALDRNGAGSAKLIEVCCGHRRVSGNGVSYMKKEHCHCDHYAVVVTGEVVVYEPAIDARDQPGVKLFDSIKDLDS